MITLTANDLKTRGVAAIEESLAHQTEATLTVRGQPRFVVMEVAQYQYLRECELDAALAQSRADMAAGQYIVETAQEHMSRLDALTSDDTLHTQQREVSSASKGRKPPASKVSRQPVRR
jgi:hypothetical protein